MFMSFEVYSRNVDAHFETLEVHQDVVETPWIMVALPVKVVAHHVEPSRLTFWTCGGSERQQLHTSMGPYFYEP
jgi:hypothetical protein